MMSSSAGRRGWLHGSLAALSVGAASVWAGSVLAGETAPKSALPSVNVILVSIDTLRADHVGAYGYPRPTTPNIDRFAAEGMLFEECIAHASSTLPSHASILTSLLPPHHGASTEKQSRLAYHVNPLAEVLRTNGYRTASFNGGIQLVSAYGLDRGFEVYESVQARSPDVEVLAGEENRLAAAVARGIAWIEASDRRPFFLFLHSYEVHHPYDPDVETLRVFDRGYDGPLPDAISFDLLWRINAGEVRLKPPDRRHIVGAYDAEIRSADEAFGALIAFLKEHQLYDDTLIVVTSDHGEELGEHGAMGWHSHTLYDELLRVPLVMRWPGMQRAGVRVSAQVRGIDIAPTMLGAVGLEIPASYMGQDLRSFGGSDPAPDLPAVSVLDGKAVQAVESVRVGDWKLHGLQLFDLGKDPTEQNDLAKRRPEVVERLRSIAHEQLGKRKLADLTPAPVSDETLERLRALGYID